MSFDQVNSSLRPRPELTNTQKKEILWNIIQPGDPYDIKKSMIAKMPGQRHNFMGEHIQLVCLMQAAQIERLCQYLEQYKLRYREIERRELDRHSYEVQIKELTQQLTDQSYHKTQNLKLRDFLKKQTAELEQLRKNSTSYDGVAKKYQDALKQIQMLIQQNSTLKTENSNLSFELQKTLARISALESTRQRELDDLRYQLTHQTNASYEREKQQLTIKFESQIHRLQIESKRLKQFNETKNRQIQQLQNKYRRLQTQLDEELSKHSYFANLENNLHEYENRFGVLSKEIERLNFVLRNKSNECEELGAKLRQCEDQLTRRNHEIQEYNVRLRRYEQNISEANTNINELNVKIRQLSESELTVKKYEQKIEQLSMEIERLNNVLKKKVSQITQYQGKLSDMDYELKKIDLVKRENEELKRFVNENSELRRRLAQFENRMPILSQQIERLNSILRAKADQTANWQIRCKNFERENETYRSRIETLERDIAGNWKTKINILEQQNQAFRRDNQEFRRRLQQSAEVNRRVTEYENRMALMSQQIERLNQVLNESRAENAEQHRKLLQANNLSRKTVQYEGRLKILMQENEGLKRQLSENQFRYSQQIQTKVATYESRLRQLGSEYDDTNRRIQDYESKITLLGQELERINGNLKKRLDQYNALEIKYRQSQQELQNSRRGYGEYESKITHITQQYQLQINNYDIRLKQISGENEEFRRKFGDYDNRIAMLSQQIQRLNGLLRNKVEENANLEGRFRSQQQEFENLRRGTSDYQYRMTQVTQELQTKIVNYQATIRQYTIQLEDLRKRNQDIPQINRKISDYEGRILLLSQQLERVNNNLRNKVDENNNLENRVRILQGENQGIKRAVSEYEFKLTNYDSRNKAITQENEELKRRLQELGDVNRKVSDYESRITMFSQQLERLNSVIKSKTEESIALDSKLKESIRQIQGFKRAQSEIESRYTSELQSKVTIYESRLKREEQGNGQLLKKINELTESNRRIPQYENKILVLSQELERLNNALRGKVDEVSSLEMRLKQSLQESQSLKRSQIQIQHRVNAEYVSKITYYETKSKQNDIELNELRRKVQDLSDSNRKLAEYENRIAIMSEQIEKLNGRLRASQDELIGYKRNNSQIELKFKQYNEANDELRRKIIQLSEQNKNLPEYESRILLLSQQLQKLNNTLRIRTDQLRASQQQADNLRRSQGGLTQELQLKVTTYETRINQLEYENNDLRQRSKDIEGNLQRKLDLEYGYKLTQLNEEIQRLNIVLKTKVDENKNLQNRLRQLQQQNEGFRRGGSEYEYRFNQATQQNDDLKRRLQNLSDVNNKLLEYQSKITLLTQQLERVNGNLRVKVEQCTNLDNRLRSIFQQNEGLKRSGSQTQIKLTQELQFQITTYETKIHQIKLQNEDLKRQLQELSDAKVKISDYESKILMMNQELEKANINLRNKVDENNSLQGSLRGLQSENDNLRRQHSESDLRTSQQYKSQIQNYQITIKDISDQNDGLKRRIQELLDGNRKLADYEGRITTLSQEIERLNIVLRAKIDQNNSLQSRIRTLQQENQSFKRTVSEYEIKITQITQEFQTKIRSYESSANDDIRIKNQELADANRKIFEYENRISQFMIQIERLNNLLKGKVGDNSNLEIQLRSTQEQLETLRRAYGELQFKFNQERQKSDELKLRLQNLGDVNRRVSQYQTKIALLTQEIERLNGTLKIKIDEYGELEIRYRNLQQEFEGFRRGTGQYESRMIMLTQQIDRLNNVLRKTAEQLQEFHQKEFKYLTEIERLNNTLRLKVEQSSRYEISHNELISKIKALEDRNNQIMTDYNSLRNTNAMLSTEYENSRKHLLEYQQSIKKLYAQFERIQNMMQELKKENYELKVLLRESEGLIEKNRVLSAQIDRLTEIIEGQKAEIAQLRIRFADQAALHKRISQHMALMVVLFAQIESLRQRVKDKEKQVEDVRRSSLAPFKV